MFSVGLTMTFLTSQIVICGMARVEFSKFQGTAYLLAAVYFAMPLIAGEDGAGLFTFNTAMYLPPQFPALNIDGLLRVAMGLAVYHYARYVLGCIHEICSVLDIKCLRINPPRGTKTK